MSKIVGSNLDNEYPLASHRPARTVKRELTQTKQVKTKDEMMKTGVREKNNPDVYGGALIENNINKNYHGRTVTKLFFGDKLRKPH